MNTRRVAAFASLAVILALVLSACTLGASVSIDAASNQDVTGRWTGMWDGASIGGGSITAYLKQTALELTGTFDLTGSACIDSGSVSGNYDGSQLTFAVESAGDTIEYSSSSVDGAIMTGTYLVTTGTCAGDAGTFSLVHAR